MKTAAIICEYNPFHYGHLFQLEQTKKLIEEQTGEDVRILALMSGDFVQRGEPSFADKWVRAEAAVRCGASLVLELPFQYACNGAAQFAMGAIEILNGLRCVDYLSFGSESGDISELIGYVHEDRERVKASLEAGMTFARSVSSSYETDILSGKPNNTLGIEYLRALERTESDIIPITVKRKAGISSSEIRKMYQLGEGIEARVPVSMDGYTDGIPFPMIASLILKESAETIDALPSAGEGIGYRMKKIIHECSSTEELIEKTRQTRYTKARIKRVLCQLLCDSGEPAMGAVRILGFDEKGRTLLKEITAREGTVRCVTNPNKATEEIRAMLGKDIHAADMYHLIRGMDLYHESDYVKKPFILLNSEQK